MDSGGYPGTWGGGVGRGLGGAFTVAWELPGQQLLVACPGIVQAGRQGRCRGQGPVSLTPG